MCFSKVVLATDRAILGATTAQAPSAMGKPPGNRHIQTGSVRAGLAPDIILVIINGIPGSLLSIGMVTAFFLKACAHWVDDS
jgi:hypothetical protein